MTLRSVIALILLLSVIRTGHAQDVPFDPCTKEFSVTKADLANNTFNWQLVGQRMQTCQAFVVVSDSAFLVQRAFREAFEANYDSLIVELKQGQRWRDSLITQQSSFITYQQGVITRYDSLLVQSNQLVTDATRNTDRALRRLSLLRWASIGGITIGLAGILAAAVAN